jgi:hypothetical protein
LQLGRIETRRRLVFTGVELAGGIELAALVEKDAADRSNEEGGWEAR